jgi:hypothetical protein
MRSLVTEVPSALLTIRCGIWLTLNTYCASIVANVSVKSEVRLFS